MALDPLQPTTDELAVFPQALPVVRRPSGAVLHGTPTCAALKGAGTTVTEYVPVTNGTITKDVHCQGTAPEWEALGRGDTTLWQYKTVNELAAKAAAGDVHAFHTLRTKYDNYGNVRIKAYAQAAVTEALETEAITRTVLLIDFMRVVMSREAFAGGSSEPSACATLGRAGNLCMLEALGAYTYTTIMHHVARQWCWQGREYLDYFGEVIQQNVSDIIARTGNGVEFGDIPRSDPAHLADLLETGFTGYLAKHATGKPLQMTLDLDRFSSLAETPYAHMYGERIGADLVVGLPEATVDLLMRVKELRNATHTVTLNGRVLNDREIHERVRSAADRDFEELNDWDDRVRQAYLERRNRNYATAQDRRATTAIRVTPPAAQHDRAPRTKQAGITLA